MWIDMVEKLDCIQNVLLFVTYQSVPSLTIPRTTSGESHVLTARGIGFSPNSGELRPGSRPSSFAYVKTASISVPSCSE